MQFYPISTHSRFRDLTGQTFGRLTVLGFGGKAPNTNMYFWICRCECGKVVRVQRSNLRSGTAKSCGCLQKELQSTRLRTHGESTTGPNYCPEYNSYCGAKGRCVNPRNRDFSKYGGRGIEFRFDSYEHFLSVLGRRPTLKHSLDRIDVNGHYEPGNVRWASTFEQQRNKRDNRMVTVEGITKSLTEWAESSGLSIATIHQRLKAHWCECCSVNAAVHKNRCPHR